MIRYFIACALWFLPLSVYSQHTDRPTDGFIITGEVSKKLHVTIKDLLQFNQQSLGNVVIGERHPGEQAPPSNLKGILLKDILDSAGIHVKDAKDYSRLYIDLIASDGYRNVYSWNELFNTSVGDHVYIITEMDNKPLAQMPKRILVMSSSDFSVGRRQLKGLTKIEVKRAE